MKKIKGIFIVDDDPITIFGISRMLKSLVECENISTYENGKLAIDDIMGLLKDKKDIPEIIFLDINMPIMDGWQFLEEFIKLPLKDIVKINIITSSIDPLDLQKCIKFKYMTQHIIEFRNKPIRKEEIEEITRIA